MTADQKNGLLKAWTQVGDARPPWKGIYRKNVYPSGTVYSGLSLTGCREEKNHFFRLVEKICRLPVQGAVPARSASTVAAYQYFYYYNYYRL
jgi:hypothetical protein